MLLSFILSLVLAISPAVDSLPSPSDISVNGSHPRLLLQKGGEAHLMEKIKTDSILLSIHNHILHESESCLDSCLLSHKLQGTSLLKISREALKRIYFLSYSFRMTGDRRYAERAISEMRNVCRFEDWNPRHFLDVAEMTMAVAIGYDWLYDELSPEDRQELALAMFGKGIAEGVPETCSDPAYCKWLDKVNNWNPVCNTSLAFAAIAAYEHDPELSKKIIARSIRLVRNLAMPEYGPDGNYPEGYTYWNYGTAYLVMFIDALEAQFGSSFGISESPGFMLTPEYILQMTTQGLGCWAYADCTARDPQSMKNSYPLFWFAARSGDSSLLWAEKRKIDEMQRAGMPMYDVRYLPSVLLWASANPFEGMREPTRRLYVGQGTTPVAIMRNHFGGHDEIFAGLKGGRCSHNHSHMDIGSFVMYRGCQQWVKDLGIQNYYSLKKYGVTLDNRSQRSSRWEALRLSNQVHNIMIFADSLQRVDARASIIDSGDCGDFVYAITDLSRVDSAAVTAHQRGIAIVDNSYVVVRDEVTNKADRETPLRWAMLTPAEVRMTDEHTAELSMNREHLYMIVEGKDISLGTWSTAPRHIYDEANPGTVMVGFSSSLSPGEVASYTVRLVPEEALGNFKQSILPLEKWKKSIKK